MTFGKHVEKSNTADHNVSHHPRPGIESYERTIRSTMHPDGKITATVGRENSGKSDILLLKGDKKDDIADRFNIPESAPVCGQPDVSSAGDTTNVVWAEQDDRVWKIAFASSDKNGEIQYLHKSQNLCMQPAVTTYKSSIWVAWSCYDSNTGNIKIYVSNKKKDDNWSSPIVFGTDNTNSFRPAMASNGKEIFIAWDFSNGKDYGIEYKIINQKNKVLAENKIITEGERRLIPAVTTGIDKSFYLSFVITREVKHKDLGIIDHRNSAGFAKIKDGKLKFLPDTRINDTDAADLREGMLGEVEYCGYYGLRRNPIPVVLKNGDVWLVWELMFELGYGKKEIIKKHNINNHAACGSLMGKKLNGTIWSNRLLIHNGGLNYCVPSKVYGNKIPVIYFDQATDKKNPEFKIQHINTDNLTVLCNDEKRWGKWTPYSAGIENRRYKTKNDDKEFKLFWADTHVHSAYSPDAEGEPDEIISYAKNISGLDIVAMVDNDFYPYYSLTPLKWCIHKELAKIFTKSGEFAVFPGYEYTYHDEKLINGFNHRYVLYPRYNGKLYRRIDPGSETMEGLTDKLKDTDALSFAHHTTWKLTGYPFDKNAEITSSWRVCMEESKFVRERLKEGDRFAFIGSSDTHRAAPGFGGALTGIYAKELTPKAIFDAYKNKRTVATQGQRIIIDFKVNDLFIGDEGEIEESPNLQLKVKSEKPIEFAEIIRDDKVVKRYENNDTFLDVKYTDDGLNQGEHYYYVRVKTKGDPSFNIPEGIKDEYKVFYVEGRYPHNLARAKGPFAWCSPVWIIKK